MNSIDPLRILLVEDDYGDAALVEVFLHEAWPANPPLIHHVTRLSEARDWLAMEEADIVLCDLSLPDAEGMDAVLNLRDNSECAPIVVLTGRDDPEFSLHLIESGAQDYLNKRELTAVNLMRAIRYAIERDRQATKLRTAMRIEQFRQSILERIAADQPLGEILDAIGRFLEQEVDCAGFAYMVAHAEELDEQLVESATTGIMHARGSLAVPTRVAGEHRMFMITGSSGQVLGQLIVSPSSRTSNDILAMCASHATELAALAIERCRIHREQKLASLVFRTSGQSIVITNAARRIVSVNPAYCQLMGYVEPELINTEPAFWSAGAHDAAFYEDMWQAIERDGHWAGEICDRKKSGDWTTLLATISAVHGLNGQVERHVCLMTDISERKAAEETIARFANYDPLTHLPNRRLFLDRLEREILHAERLQEGFALLFIDLDHFKEVNDTLGHHVGDLLLQQCSGRLQEVVRASDTVARLGGDEFTVLFPGLSKIENIDALVATILGTLNEPFTLGRDTVQGGASIGVTLYPKDGITGEDLLKHADQAMYRAKQAGRGRYCFFTSDMQQEAQSRMRMHQDLLAARRLGQFSLHYQPIVDARSEELLKIEALMRWTHPERGEVPPWQFISLAEELGLIGQLGDWALLEALCQMLEWERSHDHSPRVSINKSPRQFINHEHRDDWLSMIRDKGLCPSKLTLEITESVLLDGRQSVADQLKRYRDAGMQIAVDDFGTGYSSLGYLRRFPVDYVKIDKSFVADIAEDRQDRNLVEAIVAMCHKLGVKVIAEGVETAAQRDVLLDIGCDNMQGYLFGKPMPAERFSLPFSMN